MADITKLALEWNSQESRKRERPELSWRRTVDKEAKNIENYWVELNLCPMLLIKQKKRHLLFPKLILRSLKISIKNHKMKNMNVFFQLKELIRFFNSREKELSVKNQLAHAHLYLKIAIKLQLHPIWRCRSRDLENSPWY